MGAGYRRSGDAGLRASIRATRGFRRPLAWGLLLSAGLHAAAYPLVALLSIPGLPRQSLQEWPLKTLELPPLVEIPAPPEEVRRPDLPLPPELTLDGNLRITASGIRSADVGVDAPPTVTTGKADISLVRYDVPPLLGNRSQFGALVWNFYPRELQRARVEGAVELAMFVDMRGRVTDVRVEESSGHASMDDAAKQLAYRMEFLPAVMRDQLVGVWVHQRICFLLPHREASMTPAAAAIVRSTAATQCREASVRR